VKENENTQPFRWVQIHNKDEVEAFYRSILPTIRTAAREIGWAIGEHGSFRRDMDLIAVPWAIEHADKDELAGAIQRAACGIQNSVFKWESKSPWRSATSFPVCWTEWNEPNAGHIDLSVIEDRK
jgi:hypothetical protein